jgi:hypothetical protein
MQPKILRLSGRNPMTIYYFSHPPLTRYAAPSDKFDVLNQYFIRHLSPLSLTYLDHQGRSITSGTQTRGEGR